MAIINEVLQLNKKFLIIDSPVPFTLKANNGTDEVYRMAGAWQIDTDKLLPERYQKQYPIYTLDLFYDDTNLGGKAVTVRESNIDIGDGISGVNGQDVRVTNLSEIDLSNVATEKTLKDIYDYLPELKKNNSSVYFNDPIELNNKIGSVLNDDFLGNMSLKIKSSISALNGTYSGFIKVSGRGTEKITDLQTGVIYDIPYNDFDTTLTHTNNGIVKIRQYIDPHSQYQYNIAILKIYYLDGNGNLNEYLIDDTNILQFQSFRGVCIC